MNVVQVTGRLTKDPELRYSTNGNPYTTVTIAVDDYDFKAKEKIAYFFPVVIWGKSAENLVKYQNKGSKILVKGKLRARSYDAQDGSKRYVTEIVADTNGGIEYMSSVNKDNASNSYNNNYYNQHTNTNNNTSQKSYSNQQQQSAPAQNLNDNAFNDAFAGFGSSDFFPVDDNDIPF